VAYVEMQDLGRRPRRHHRPRRQRPPRAYQRAAPYYQPTHYYPSYYRRTYYGEPVIPDAIPPRWVAARAANTRRRRKGRGPLDGGGIVAWWENLDPIARLLLGGAALGGAGMIGYRRAKKGGAP